MSRTAEAAPAAATTRRAAGVRQACASGLAAVAVLAASAGCGGNSSAPGGGGASGTSGAAGSSGSGGGTAVQVQNFSFKPASLTVPVGAKVTWTFADSAPHNVKADDGSFSSPTLNGGKTYSYTFAKAGTYHYICTIHQYMSGTITVK